MDKITIEVGFQRGGCAFGLSPKTILMLRQRFPSLTLSPSQIYLGFDSEAAYDKLYDASSGWWRQVSFMLTGLTPEELSEQFDEIEFVNPVKRETLFSSAA